MDSDLDAKAVDFRVIVGVNPTGELLRVRVNSPSEDMLAIKSLVARGYTQIYQSEIRGAHFGLSIPGVAFLGCKFVNGTWNGVTANGMQWSNCTFENWKFTGCDLRGATLLSSEYQGIVVMGSDLRGALMQGTKISDSQLRCNDIHGFMFMGFRETVNTEAFHNEGIILTDEIGKEVFYRGDTRGQDQRAS